MAITELDIHSLDFDGYFLNIQHADLFYLQEFPQQQCVSLRISNLKPPVFYTIVESRKCYMVHEDPSSLLEKLQLHLKDDFKVCWIRFQLTTIYEICSISEQKNFKLSFRDSLLGLKSDESFVSFKRELLVYLLPYGRDYFHHHPPLWRDYFHPHHSSPLWKNNLRSNLKVCHILWTNRLQVL